MRQEHRAGDKMFIDFAGQTIPLVEPATGVITEAELFVTVLGASNYLYAEAFPSQALPYWIAGHAHALAFYGGSPRVWVCANLQSGVTQAIARGAFQKGVTTAGTPKWKDAASTKGSQRYGPGVAVAQPDFTSGFQPYLQVIQTTTLPQRQAKGSPSNYDRTRAIGTALHAKKVGG